VNGLLVFDNNNHGDKYLLEIIHLASGMVEIVYVFRYHVTQQNVTYQGVHLSLTLCNMIETGLWLRSIEHDNLNEQK
jgi:hypothetical protein